MTESKNIDVDKYLQRIGLNKQKPSLKYLRQLHRNHLLSVPYENLDFHYKKTIVLDIPKLFDKVVNHHRGGISFELNILFYYLLDRLGFEVQLISARHKLGDELSPEFDHVVVLVKSLNGLDYICDIGFGDHILFPKELKLNYSQLDFTKYYRFEKDADDNWILKTSSDNSTFYFVYQFTEQPRGQIEFIPRLNQHQDSLDSRYHQEKLITQLFPEGRITLTSHQLIINLKGEPITKEILNEDAFLVQLEQHFGIRVQDLLRQVIH